jgi:hypothetical protein
MGWLERSGIHAGCPTPQKPDGAAPGSVKTAVFAGGAFCCTAAWTARGSMSPWGGSSPSANGVGGEGKGDGTGSPLGGATARALPPTLLRSAAGVARATLDGVEKPQNPERPPEISSGWNISVRDRMVLPVAHVKPLSPGPRDLGGAQGLSLLFRLRRVGCVAPCEQIAQQSFVADRS